MFAGGDLAQGFSVLLQGAAAAATQAQPAQTRPRGLGSNYTREQRRWAQKTSTKSGVGGQGKGKGKSHGKGKGKGTGGKPGKGKGKGKGMAPVTPAPGPAVATPPTAAAEIWCTKCHQKGHLRMQCKHPTGLCLTCQHRGLPSAHDPMFNCPSR